MATIGYTTNGGSGWSLLGNRGVAYGEAANTTTDASGGTADGYTVDVNSSISSGENYDIGIYTDDGGGGYGDPETLQTPLLADGVAGTGSDEETDSGLSGPSLSASTMYWLAIWCDSGFSVAYDGSSPTECARYYEIGSGGLPATWDVDSDTAVTRRCTISVTYTSVVAGSVCWGHVTGVTQDNTRTFTTNWTGTGTISGSGDSETVKLASGEYVESEVVNVGAGSTTITLDDYATGSGSPTVKYKDGDTEANCEADTWNTYSTPFTSQGFVKVRLEEA